MPKSFFNILIPFQWVKTNLARKLISYSLYSLFIFGLLLIFIDQAIGFYVRQNIYTNIETLPHRPYGLVLGTSKYFAKNTPNLFYSYRLFAAHELVKRNKIDYLLLSGDNRTKAYNEPRMMFNDLKRMGVPEELMYMDYAGFRTLDSVIRAKHVFKANSMTIITQKFHCERALFIAKYHNIDAICFAAEYPSGYTFVRFREFFARLQAVLDLLIEKEPHFLGKPEPLPPPLASY